MYRNERLLNLTEHLQGKRLKNEDSNVIHVDFCMDRPAVCSHHSTVDLIPDDVA